MGQKKPNAWELYDMSGNVWEWCEDNYDSYENAPRDGSAWLTNDSDVRILRGGSWNLYSYNCRSAIRSGFRRVFSFDFFGFRVACVSPVV